MLTLLLALSGCADPADAGHEPPHRDLVMVSIDTLRRDRVGRWDGSDRTPFLDGLLERSLTLDAHHACANWTYGAFYCALGGADGVDMGWVPYGGETPPAIPGDADLLPGLLGRSGFVSGLVSTNGYVGTTSKLDRFYDHFLAVDMAPADQVVDEGLAMLDTLERAERWFLHLHFFDPHSPYGAPDAYLDELDALPPIDFDLDQMAEVQRLAAQWDALDAATQAAILEHLRVRYEGAIRFLDDELSRLYDALEADGALADALLVVWSDHGEQFFEYGQLEHGKSLHGIEVDTFAAFHGAAVDPAAWTGPTTHADLSPTILALMGLPPDALTPPGTPGVPAGEADPDRPLFGVKNAGADSQHSVDRGGRRLIYTWDGQRHLYDLAADPEEREDLFSEDDPDAQALWDLLLPRVEALAEQVDDARPVLP